ncbi:MAG: HAD family hydrolase [Cytophagaceae bacterium]|nr:HAD family hydrolase [Gemmatimonadaceae bacterium]
MKLILFDIDGTILWTSGAGRRAMEGALHEHFGATGPASYRYDGKTDIQIVRESMREVGIADAHIDAQIDAVMASYLARLVDELAAPHTQMKRYDGVMELLDALEQREDRILGLLTGNIIDGASHKLRAVGVEPSRFRLGAYGSDHEHRHELPAIAVRRAAEALGHVIPGHQVIIIGDTPADIHCGRPIGARAIGVATGHYSVDDLLAHDPAAVFADLADTDAVMRAIDDA